MNSIEQDMYKEIGPLVSTQKLASFLRCSRSTAARLLEKVEPINSGANKRYYYYKDVCAAIRRA